VRREAYLPVHVTDAAGEFLATTSLSASSWSHRRGLEVGTEISVRLTSGVKEWRQVATVTRVVPMRSARPEFSTWHLGLRLRPSDASALDGLLLEEAA
jgi:hypothetical protein